MERISPRILERLPARLFFDIIVKKMINNELKEKIRKSKEGSIWDLGNQVLYDLCEKYPEHKTEEEIIAKIWLIGRSYAAAIERRRMDDKIANDMFYEKAAQEIKQSSIDFWFSKCRKEIDKNVILETHKNLVDLFYKITGLKKRSLASKYLHFHFPDKFFIYDSRAVNGLGKLAKDLKLPRINSSKNPDYDNNYANFYSMCSAVRDKIKEEYPKECGEGLSCREFDIILIENL